MPKKRDQPQHEAPKPTNVHERGYPSGTVPTSQIQVPKDALRPHPQSPGPADQGPSGQTQEPTKD